MAKIITCTCGQQIECLHFTNTCECGRDYNHAGQGLAPRSQWGEETGEHWTDCLGPDYAGPGANNVEKSYSCPVCEHEFDYGDQCEHMYFDSQVYDSPLLKRKYQRYSIVQLTFAVSVTDQQREDFFGEFRDKIHDLGGTLNILEEENSDG